MSYYPIFSLPFAESFVVVHNFSPSSLQFVRPRRRYLYITYTDGTKWTTTLLHEMIPFSSFEVSYYQISHLLPSSSTGFLFLSTNSTLEQVTSILPPSDTPLTLPAWRSTIGVRLTSGVTSSYQGEILPFPPKASLLTFDLLSQKSPHLANYLLFFNLQSAPEISAHSLQVNDLLPPHGLRDSHVLYSNSLTLIPLSNSAYDQASPLVFTSRAVSGVPLFLTISKDYNSISLEHTHPPAALSIFGNRYAVQKSLKSRWFSLVNG